MTGWIVSICGIALFAILVDVILPEGNTKKYVVAVVGVVLTFTMLLPMSKLFDTTNDIHMSMQQDVSLQTSYIDGIEEQKDLARVQQVQRVILDLQIANATVTLQSNGYICVKAQCSKSMLEDLQNILASMEDKIMILWSDSNG